MPFRISPVWWPVLFAASPVLMPLLALKHRPLGRFEQDLSAETTLLEAGEAYCT
jgi:hypothetical protein